MRRRLAVGQSGPEPAHEDADPTRELAEPDRPDSVQPFAGVRKWWHQARHRAERAGVREFTAPASTRLFLLLLVAAMLCGPAALVVLVRADHSQPAPVIQTPAGPSDRDMARAGSAAAELVRVWLSAGSKDTATVTAVMGRDPGPFTLPAVRPPAPLWVSVRDAEETEPGEWTVTVSAGGQTGTATYMVLVSVTSQQAAPMTLPTRMAQPRLVPVNSDLSRLAAGNPIAVTTAGFVESLLTGADDLSRWLTPDSTVQPTGQTCQTVKLRQVEAAVDSQDSTGPVIDVLATADCQITSDTSQVRTLQYPLTLELRDGRWEVAGYASTLPRTATTTADNHPDGTPSPATADPTTPPPTDPGSR